MNRSNGQGGTVREQGNVKSQQVLAKIIMYMYFMILASYTARVFARFLWKKVMVKSTTCSENKAIYFKMISNNPVWEEEEGVEIRQVLEISSFFLFLQVDLNDESFNVSIDRGELDRLHKDCSSCQRTDSNIIEYFEVVQRILKVGGRFICFSFATEDILDKLLHYFSSGWFFRVHLVNKETSGGKSIPLPLFCLVLTKTKFAGWFFL